VRSICNWINGAHYMILQHICMQHSIRTLWLIPALKVSS